MKNASPFNFGLIESCILVADTKNKIVYANIQAIIALKFQHDKILGVKLNNLLQNSNNQESLDGKNACLINSEGKKIDAKISLIKLTKSQDYLDGTLIIFKLDPTNHSADKSANLTNKKILLQNLEEKFVKLQNYIKEEPQKRTIALTTSLEAFHSAFNSLNQAIIIVENEKNITFMNQATINLLGLKPIYPLDINILNQCLNTNLIFNGENNISQRHQNIKINNKSLDLHIQLISFENTNSQQANGFCLIIDDKNIEKLVKKSKENFFIIASHELRTPLTAIRGYIAIINDLFRKDITNENLQRIIQDIDASSQRLIGIINDFLDKSKLDEDKISVSLNQVDLIPIIESCIKDTNSLALQKKLQINFNKSLASAVIMGDKDKIKQVIINLLSNGIKYTPHGSLNIWIALEEEKYKIYIQDTGRGIPKESIQSLFSKYQKTDPNKPAGIISTGLGLYIAKLLVNKMNGVIKLENSEINKGSTFSLAFPVYTQAIAIADTKH